MPNVILEIYIPDNEYCWDGTTRCRYVDLHEFSCRAASCGLKFDIPPMDRSGKVHKSEACMLLKAK